MSIRRRIEGLEARSAPPDRIDTILIKSGVPRCSDLDVAEGAVLVALVWDQARNCYTSIRCEDADSRIAFPGGSIKAQGST